MVTPMSRIVSIKQSEPGLYVINLQRSRFSSISTLLKAIASPPLESTAAVAAGGNGYAVGPVPEAETADADAARTTRNASK